LVDLAIRQADTPRALNPITIRSAATRIVVEKVVGPDGVLRYVMRQIH
jgi:hypothetical protein